jgi:TPR repeat protein
VCTESDQWERDNSNEWELWCEESAENLQLIEEANTVWETDLAAAFRLYLQAADAGSIWAMQVVARCCDEGIGVAADHGLAKDYYLRAINAGSWIATIQYARSLARHGDHAECEKILEDGVRASFAPACFWLAWYRRKRSTSRTARRELRPLLEAAARMGHPAAKSMLRGMMMMGDFGLREIPRGFANAA